MFYRSTLLVAFVLCAAQVGCFEDDDPPPSPRDAGIDDGGGTFDTGTDTSMPPPADIDPFGGFAAERADSGEALNMDSPSAGAPSDCFVPEPTTASPCESACGAVTLCSVGSASLCAPFQQLLTLDSLRCGDDDSVQCLDSSTPFGDPAGFILNDALHPGGDDRTQGGAVLSEDMATGTTGFVIRAEFQAPACSAPPCLESAALGFMPTDHALYEGALRERVTPPLSVGIAGFPTQLLVTLEGEVVHRVPFDGSNVEVRTNPSGHVLVRHGEMSWSSEFEFASAMDLVLIGRNTNPTATDVGAALKSISLMGGECDRVDGFAPLAPLEAVEGGLPVSQSALADVELMEIDGRPFMLSAGDVLRAYPIVDGGLVARGELVIQGGEGLRQPEVVQVDDGVELYAFDGDQLIVASLTQGEDGLVLGPRAEVTIGRGLTGELSLGSPTVAFANDTYLMVAVSQQGKSRLVALHSTDGRHFIPAVVEDEDLMLRALTLDDALVDLGVSPRGRPSLVLQGSVFHLFVEAREGTRSAIYDLKSETFLEWSLAGTGAVVAATGGRMQRLGSGYPRALFTEGTAGGAGSLHLLVDATLPNANVVALTQRLAFMPGSSRSGDTPADPDAPSDGPDDTPTPSDP